MDKLKLVASVLEDMTINATPPPIHEAFKFYNNLWSKDVKDDEVVEVKRIVNCKSVYLPISVEELNDALKATKKNAASGIDRVSISDIKQIHKRELCMS